jgi:hypothetical protein
MEADSTQLTERMNMTGGGFKAKDVSSYLYVLKGKGFVMQVTERKRIAGGSLWCITYTAQALIREKYHEWSSKSWGKGRKPD